jgi:hypothetical protein
LTYAPRRVHWNGVSAALATSATPGVIISLALGSPLGYVTAVVAAAAAVWLVRRAFRIRFVATDEGVTIDNYWRTHKLMWAEVEGVGIGLKGSFPRPALAFKLRGGGAVFAQATPLRKKERQEFQGTVLALAPSTVVALQDAAGWIGTDRALTSRLRRWWLKAQPARPTLRAQGSDQVWLEEPLLWPASLLVAIGTLMGSGLALIVGISLLVGTFKDDAGAPRYFAAILILIAGILGCVRFVLIVKRRSHARHLSSGARTNRPPG